MVLQPLVLRCFRPNLFLSVTLKSGANADDLRSHMTQDARGHYQFEGATIVYCPTKKATEEIEGTLKCESLSSAKYV